MMMEICMLFMNSAPYPCFNLFSNEKKIILIFNICYIRSPFFIWKASKMLISSLMTVKNSQIKFLFWKKKCSLLCRMLHLLIKFSLETLELCYKTYVKTVKGDVFHSSTLTCSNQLCYKTLFSSEVCGLWLNHFGYIWHKLVFKFIYKILLFAFKVLHGYVPSYLFDLLSRCTPARWGLRTKCSWLYRGPD